MAVQVASGAAAGVVFVQRSISVLLKLERDKQEH